MDCHRRMLLAALLWVWSSGCATRVSPALVAWRPDAPTIAPSESGQETGGVGRLVVATDRDETQIGSKYYYNVRRPYELYSADGELLRKVENQGWRQGEEPETIVLPAGRYVVASVYGKVYRRVQVEIRSGAKTEVSEDNLRSGPAVFADSHH